MRCICSTLSVVFSVAVYIPTDVNLYEVISSHITKQQDGIYIVTDDLIQLTIDFFFNLNSTTVATSLAGTRYPGPCLHEHFSPIQFPASPANFKLSNCAQTKLQQLSLLSQELRFISILLKNNPASNSPIKYKSFQIYY